MVRSGSRHLVVLDQGKVAGILSVRDIARCWAAERGGELDELPPSAERAGSTRPAAATRRRPGRP